MSGKGRSTISKRHKEQKRRERQREKAERKSLRKQQKAVLADGPREWARDCGSVEPRALATDFGTKPAQRGTYRSNLLLGG